MKKIFTLLFLFIASYSYGQSIKLMYDGRMINSGDSIILPTNSSVVSDNIYYFDVINSTDNMVDAQIVRKQITLLNGAVESFCWLTCYDPQVDSSGVMAIFPKDTIRENETGQYFKVEYTPNSVGQSVSSYKIINTSGTDDDYILFYLVYTSEVSIPHIKPTVSLLNAFPNPVSASSRLTIQYNVKNNNSKDLKLVIKNLMGSAVSVIPLSQAADQISLELNHLKSGLYLYSIEANGVTLLTKKLSVR